MKIEIYELAQTQNRSYKLLGSIECDATPIRESFISYNNNYYQVLYVVLAEKRVVAFVELKKSQQLGLEVAF